MTKINKRIAIVRSSTKRLSSMGQKSCDMIFIVLEKHYEHVEIITVNNLTDLDELVLKKPDLVFLGVKMIPIKDKLSKKVRKLWLSAYLDDCGISYTGSTAAAIALDFDKPSAKEVVKSAGLKTSDYFIAKDGMYLSGDDLPLPYPLFIKPPNTGGGRGIDDNSVVRNFNEFKNKVASIAREFDADALVESYLPNREFSVAVLENVDSDGLLIMPIELIAETNSRGDRILGKKIKNADTESVIVVADGVLRDTITDLAAFAFRALGARDYGRIDIRLDDKSIPHFLEVNLIPGVAYHDFTSYFTRACWLNETLGYESMILRIVELGLSRNLISKAPYITGTKAIVNQLKPTLGLV